MTDNFCDVMFIYEVITMGGPEMTDNFADSGDSGSGLNEIRGTSERPPQFSVVNEATPIFVQIARQIIAAIKQGDIALGARLPSEIDLSKQFAVSRASVREALSSLQFAGYVESRRGSGTIVVSRFARGTGQLWDKGLVMAGNILDVLEARLVIEPETVRQAAMNPSASAMSHVHKLLEGMELTINHPELNARTDLGIHLIFAKTCQNPFLSHMTEQLVTHSEGKLWRSIRDRAWEEGKLPRTWLGHHESIARAVAERKPELAASGMKAHLLSVVGNVLSSKLSDHDRQRAKAIVERYSEDGEV